MRVVAAEFRVCHHCHGDLIRSAVRQGRPIRVSDLDRGLYDHSRCPTCGRPPDPGLTYHTGRKNWLIVPAEWGGGYEAVDRFHCPGCGNLFATYRDHCPLCHRWVSRRRPTGVWARSVHMRHAA